MAILHNLGFPRIGASRELKFALESYWQGQTGSDDLLATAAKLRERHWQLQSGLDWQPVGDFSLYDQMLDISVTLGNLPARALGGKDLDSYFRAARGRAPHDSDCQCKHAAEMTKWFDTNYHYLVPELDANSQFALYPARLLGELGEAKVSGAAGFVQAISARRACPDAAGGVGKAGDRGRRYAATGELRRSTGA